MIFRFSLIILWVVISKMLGGWEKLSASWAVATLAELYQIRHGAQQLYCLGDGALIEATEEVTAGAPVADVLGSYCQLTLKVPCADGDHPLRWRLVPAP